MSSPACPRATGSSPARDDWADAPSQVSSASAVSGPASPTSTAAWARPSLPVEVLIAIFKLALHRSTKTSTPDTSPISPMKPFASLLIASRTFRALAIPYVYRSITIARPRDWVAFFGVGRGAFVVGYDLVEKLAALKEICLLEEVLFPLDLETEVARDRGAFVRAKDKSQFELLAPLKFDLADKLTCLTVLNLPYEISKHVKVLGLADVTALAHRLYVDKAVQAQYVKELVRKGHLGLQEDDQGYVMASIRYDVENEYKEAQMDGLFSFFHDIEPCVVRLSADKSSTIIPEDCGEIHCERIRFVIYDAGFDQSGRGTQYAAISRAEGVLDNFFPECVVETEEEETARLKAKKKQKKNKKKTNLSKVNAA